jgi:hypothetical protein
MSIKTLKDAGAYAEKYSTRASAAVNDFVAGVNATTGQAAAAAAAADKWQQGVSAPSAKASFISNINAAGDQAWKNGVTTKGQARYGPGVAAGKQKWANMVQKFFAALKGTTLPPRGLRGSAQNAQISAQVQSLLHATKTGGAVGG